MLGEHPLPRDWAGPHGIDLVKVDARTEAPACARQNDRANATVLTCRNQCLSPPVDHRPCECTQLVWPIDADQADPIPDLIGKRLVGHRSTTLRATPERTLLFGPGGNVSCGYPVPERL